MFSCIWAFGSVLRNQVRKDFDKMLRSKVTGNKEELSTIAQLKNKLLKKNKQAEQGDFKPTPVFEKPAKGPFFLVPFPIEYSIFDVFFDLD